MHINLSESVWFFDIDDTLINTGEASVTASEGIRKVMESNFGEQKAKEIQDAYNALFKTMMSSHQSGTNADAQQIRDRIISLQTDIKKQYGSVKMWSREIFIKLAADEVGITVAPEVIKEAGDAYFTTLAERVSVIRGVLPLMEKIKEAGRPIFLISGSDARFTINPSGQFFYDPKYSEALKRERLATLREKGIHFNAISIGDPEDKPHRDFFQKGIKTAEEVLSHKVDLSKSIMVGDSFAADLKTPKEELGFGLVVLYEKDRTTPEVIDEHQINVGMLTDVLSFVK